MSTVEINLIRRVVIHHLVKYDLDSLVKRIANHAISGNYIPHLFWCNGFLVDYSTFDETIYIQKERIENNTQHLRLVMFAPMSEFKDKIELKNGGHLLISNVSYDLNLQAITEKLAEIMKE